MKTLALEFSSRARSVAAGTEAQSQSISETHPERSTNAFHLIEAVLERACLNRTAIECVAIGLGPGSYTGIRVALALAQGWQFSQDVRLVGVSSFVVMAETARLLGTRGDICFAVDAQRGEFGVVDFKISDRGIAQIGGVRLLPARELKNVANLHGPDFIGDGVGTPLFPAAAALVQLATGLNSVSGETLCPIYLREAQFVKAAPPRQW